jgi:hypothetical protein
MRRSAAATKDLYPTCRISSLDWRERGGGGERERARAREREREKRGGVLRERERERREKFMENQIDD